MGHHNYNGYSIDIGCNFSVQWYIRFHIEIKLRVHVRWFVTRSWCISQCWYTNEKNQTFTSQIASNGRSGYEQWWANDIIKRFIHLIFCKPNTIFFFSYIELFWFFRWREWSASDLLENWTKVPEIHEIYVDFFHYKYTSCVLSSFYLVDCFIIQRKLWYINLASSVRLSVTLRYDNTAWLVCHVGHSYDHGSVIRVGNGIIFLLFYMLLPLHPSHVWSLRFSDAIDSSIIWKKTKA